MFKKLMLLAASAIFIVSISACGKQEAEQAPADGMAPQGEMAIPQKGQEATVDVPAEVQKAWKAIKVKVINKADNSAKEYDVEIGGEMKLPGTDLTIKAVNFLPAFNMQGLNITSASNDPVNPAAKVQISEGGQEVFKGWLFQMHPEVHAFTHEQYSVTLVEGVPAK